MSSPNIHSKQAKEEWLRPARISPLYRSPLTKSNHSPKRGRTARRRYTGKKGRSNTPYPRKNRTPPIQ